MAGEIYLQARVIQKVATTEEWQDINLDPLIDGELYLYRDVDGKPRNFKIGDGVNQPRDIPYFFDASIRVPFFGTATPSSVPSPATGDGFWIATEAGTYTNYGGVVLPSNSFGIITRVGTTYGILVTTIDLSGYATQDEVDYILNLGIEDRNKGYDVISVFQSQYTDTGIGIRASDGARVVQVLLTSSDFIELPPYWERIVYSGFQSGTFGIAFYNTNNISGYLGGQTGTAFNDMEVLKATYPTATHFKYCWNFANTGYFLNILTKIDLSKTYPPLAAGLGQFVSLDNDRKKDLLTSTIAKSILTKADIGIVAATGAFQANTAVASTKFERLPDDWATISVTLPLSTVFGLVLYNESMVRVAGFPGSASEIITQQINKSDYPTAVYYRTTFNDNAVDTFNMHIKSISLPTEIRNNTYFEDRFKYIGGLEQTNLTFSEYFTIVGLMRISTGKIDPTLTAYRSTDYLEVPSDFRFMEYSTFDSILSGVLFFDEAKNLVKSFSSGGVNMEYKRRIFASEVVGAKYFTYTWNSTFGNLDFRIYSRPAEIAPEPIPVQTRLANLNKKNFTQFNAENPSTPITQEKVFDGTEVVDFPYARIPSIIVTNTGTVLAATELRSLASSGNDNGEFQLLVKRKISGGTTWTTTNLFPYNAASYGRAMNPSFVIDRTGVHGVIGRIYCFVLTVKDPVKLAISSTRAELDCLYRISDDDGVTWGAITSIKGVWPADTVFIGAGSSPANGIQLTNGSLIVPAMCVKNSFWHSCLIYKEVSGDWSFSEITPRYGDNESTCAEGTDNEVILNCRFDNASGRNKNTKRSVYSFKMADKKFTTHASDMTFEGYISCQASLNRVLYNTRNIYLFTFPDSSSVMNPNPNNSRVNITVWASLDLIKWIRVYVIHEPISLGYSVLSFYNGKMVVIYEVNSPVLTEDMQDITPILPLIERSVLVDINKTTEEKINDLLNLI